MKNGDHVTTSNPDPAGTAYSFTPNLEESVVRLSNDLTTVQNFFTPSGSFGYAALDGGDQDLGAGGGYSSLTKDAGMVDVRWRAIHDNHGALNASSQARSSSSESR
jgi:hypothetical protein